MKFVTYYHLASNGGQEKASAETACVILRAGGDPLLWSHVQDHEKEKNFVLQAKSGIDLEQYGLAENEQLKLLAEHNSVEWLKKLAEFDIDLKEVVDFDEQKINYMLLIPEYYPEIDVFSYVKSGYNLKQVVHIARELQTGTEPESIEQLVNNRALDDDQINYLRFLAKEGADITKLVNFTDEQLGSIYFLCRNSSRDIINVVMKKPEFYQRLHSEKMLEMCLHLELYRIADAETLSGDLDETTFYKRYSELVKQRLHEIVEQENKDSNKYDCNYVQEILQHSLDIKIQQKLLDIHRKGGQITPFILLYKKDKYLFDWAKYYFDKTGVEPTAYITTWDFNQTPISEQFADYLRKQLNFDSDPEECFLDTLMTLYSAHRKGINLLPYAQAGLNASAMEEIAKYIEEGKPVPPPETSVRIFMYFNDALELYAEYGIDLFKLAQKNRDSSIATHILRMFNATKYDKKQLRTAIQFAHQLIEVTVKQGKYFDRWQLKQIHLGILQGVDVSVYAEPEYSSDVMAVMRKGLKAGINLKPYVDYIYNSGDTYIINTAGDIARHILNFLTEGQIPDIKAKNANTANREPFLLALSVIKQCQNRDHTLHNNR